MVFSSPTFLFVFLPLVLVLVKLFGGVGMRNAILLIASLIFYAWGEPVFVLVLLLSSFVAWQSGRWIARHPGRRLVLGLSVGWQVMTLVIAKYWDFLALNFQSIGLGVPVIGIPLPLGISFFTFQAISYLVDVYRGEAEPSERFDRVLLYIAMFPQLIAGPIVRYQTVARQLTRDATSTRRTMVGIQLFVMGLAQKALIANEVGPLADIAFSMGPSLDAGEAWLGIIAYSLQIYYDFSGYSNMAIGLGLIFGFTFPRNFADPYTSLSITEFWRRWHMSLSRWFRDYVYIPLGGNRVSPVRMYANLIAVFALTGIWHGAAWTFMIWGLWHGLFLILERVFPLSRLGVFGWIYVILVVLIGWVFFRAEDFPTAMGYLAAMAGQGGDGAMATEMVLALNRSSLMAMVIGLAFALTRARWRKAAVARLGAGLPRSLATQTVTALLLVLAILSVAASSYNPFLYFRF